MYKFQFLIGIINLTRFTKQDQNIIVSIPYRYYKSYGWTTKLRINQEFQFLIGIINHIADEGVVMTILCFNSL